MEPEATTEKKMRLIWGKSIRNFEPEEILSPSQMKLFKRGILPMSFGAVVKLQYFRDYLRAELGREIRLVVNTGKHKRRGARSILEVLAINKTRPNRYSFHLWCAFDVSSPDLAPNVLANFAWESRLFGGIGRYKTFTHLDCRDNLLGNVAEWKG